MDAGTSAPVRQCSTQQQRTSERTNERTNELLSVVVTTVNQTARRPTDHSFCVAQKVHVGCAQLETLFYVLYSVIMYFLFFAICTELQYITKLVKLIIITVQY